MGNLEFVEEDRVELVVNDKGGEHLELKKAITELKSVGTLFDVSHPWIVPLYGCSLAGASLGSSI